MTTNKIYDKIEAVEKWGFNIALDVNLDELMYYMSWCDGKQFRKDLFNEDRFVKEYVTGKFHDFQDRFPLFLHSLDNTRKTRFCVAVHEFYINNYKEITDDSNR